MQEVHFLGFISGLLDLPRSGVSLDSISVLGVGVVHLHAVPTHHRPQAAREAQPFPLPLTTSTSPFSPKLPGTIQ